MSDYGPTVVWDPRDLDDEAYELREEAYWEARDNRDAELAEDGDGYDEEES